MALGSRTADVAMGEALNDAGAGAPARGLRSAKLVRVAMRLPLVYHGVLKEEADLFSAPRSSFLEMLLRRRCGMLDFSRPASAPEYECSREMLEDTENWAWYLKPEAKALLDEDRLRSGRLTPAAWTVLTLNEWIGGPPLIREPEDAAPGFVHGLAARATAVSYREPSLK